MKKPCLYADFNNADPQGRLRLNCAGTIHDLAEQGVRLRPGLAVVLHDEELEADGEVQLSTEEAIWVASVDWKQIRKRPADMPTVVAQGGGAT